MRYKAIIPFTDDMGSVSPIMCEDSLMESAEENALWQLNSMRDHDGLPHLEELPPGVQFEVVED